MKRLALLAALVAVIGCKTPPYQVTHVGANTHLTGDGVRGGDLGGSFELDGVGGSLAVTADQYKRPVFDGEQTHIGAGIDFGLRVSLFGLFNQDAIAHWFDLGAAGGVGGGLIYPARLSTYGQAWAGGWVTIGLYPGRSFPSLVLQARQQTVSDWNDETVYTVGLAWSQRVFDTLVFH